MNELSKKRIKAPNPKRSKISGTSHHIFSFQKHQIFFNNPHSFFSSKIDWIIWKSMLHFKVKQKKIDLERLRMKRHLYESEEF